MSKKSERLANTRIPELLLSARTKNALLAEGISLIGELQSMTPRDVAKIKNLGEKSLQELRRKLCAFGAPLQGDPKDMKKLEASMAAESLRAVFRDLVRKKWFQDAVTYGMTADSACSLLRETINDSVARDVLEN